MESRRGLGEGSGEKQGPQASRTPGRVQTPLGERQHKKFQVSVWAWLHQQAHRVPGGCSPLPPGVLRTALAKQSSRSSRFGVGGRNLSIPLKSQSGQPEARDGSGMTGKQQLGFWAGGCGHERNRCGKGTPDSSQRGSPQPGIQQVREWWTRPGRHRGELGRRTRESRAGQKWLTLMEPRDPCFLWEDSLHNMPKQWRLPAARREQGMGTWTLTSSFDEV